MNRFVPVFLCLIFTCSMYGQKSKWLALTDCGDYINVLKSAIDDQGNVFVAGRFAGETAFQSSSPTDSVIKKYSISYSRVNFLACYTPEGKIKFVHKIEGGENFAVRAMCKQTNNCVLLFCYGTGNIVRQGEKKQSYYHFGNGGSVFNINSDGEIIWVKQLPEVAHHAETDPIGNIYLSYHGTYSKKNSILKYNKDLELLGKVETGSSTLYSMKFTKGQLYALVENTGNITLCNANFSTASLDSLKSWQAPTYLFNSMPVSLGFRSVLNEYNGKIYADLFMLSYKASYNFLGEKVEQKSGYSKIYRLGEDGSIKKSESFNAGHGNQNIFSGKDGADYLVFNLYDTLRTANNKLLVSERYSQFVSELVYAKLNKNLEFEWLAKGGGTASVYNSSFILESPTGDVYGISDLFEHGNFGSDYIELKWKSGYYVMRLSQK